MGNQSHGIETKDRLSKWERGSTAAERLAAQILLYAGYEGIDPVHPVGGPDGRKDIVCRRAGQKWIGAAYFPSSDRTVAEVTKKFAEDLEGVAKNGANGIAFVTNQHLTDAERDALREMAGGEAQADIFHLERVTTLLNQPRLYGVRLEFLEIELEIEEQIAFCKEFADDCNAAMKRAETVVQAMESHLGAGREASLGIGGALRDMGAFKTLLHSIMPNHMLSAASMTTFGRQPDVRDLRVPLADMERFVELLRAIMPARDYLAAGAHSFHAKSLDVRDLQVPLERLREFVATFDKFEGNARDPGGLLDGGRESRLERLREYERTLDRVLTKQRQVEQWEGAGKMGLVAKDGEGGG